MNVGVIVVASLIYRTEQTWMDRMNRIKTQKHDKTNGRNYETREKRKKNEKSVSETYPPSHGKGGTVIRPYPLPKRAGEDEKIAEPDGAVSIQVEPDSANFRNVNRLVLSVPP